MQPLGFTLAADPRDNQDALALDEQDGIAVVVDGAGLPRDPEAGCRHPVSWHSRAPAERYRDLLRDRALPMDEVLALAITQVRAGTASRVPPGPYGPEHDGGGLP